MKLDEKLVRLRKEKGLTQLELAEAVKVSRQAVSKWEAGGAVPSTDNLKGLSDLFGVPVDFLLNDGEERTEDAIPPSKGSEEIAEISCKDTKKAVIKWAALILAFIILAVCIWILFENKSKEELIEIDEMIGEEVELSRNFSVGW